MAFYSATETKMQVGNSSNRKRRLLPTTTERKARISKTVEKLYTYLHLYNIVV